VKCTNVCMVSVTLEVVGGGGEGGGKISGGFSEVAAFYNLRPLNYM